MFNKIRNIIQSLYDNFRNKKSSTSVVNEEREIKKVELDFNSFSNEEILAILESTDLLPFEDKTNNKNDDYLFEDTCDHEDFYDEDPIEKFHREQKELAKKIIENPTFPYFRRFCHPNAEKMIVTDFKNEGRPFNIDDYNNIFNKYISKEHFLNEEKLPFLTKIWEDAHYLKEVFKPLEEMGIDYVLDLTGGSVRDYVLGKHEQIKDLDFMLSIQDEHLSFYKLERYFPQEHITELNLDNEDTLDSKKIKLIQLCFMAHNEKMEIFNNVGLEKKPETDSYHGYNESTKKARLIGVIKNSSEKTHYPIDILLTDYSKVEFINDFDFDICKASFCFINPHVKKDFPLEPSHLISRFVAPNEFWADVHNKFISYDAKARNTKHIDAAFEKHLPRIEAKYPDHKTIVVGEGENKPYALAKILTMELNIELDNKEVVKPQKKLKL